MTREEILVLLKEMKQNTINGAAYDDPKRERKFIALDEAIKELEKEPCEDAISREDALMCMTGEFSPGVLYNPEAIISKRIQRIQALPSVKPKPTECEDAISRADAINKVTNFYTNCERLKMFQHTSNEVKQTVVDILSDLPPVQPKIKVGHWIHTSGYNFQCSECGFIQHESMSEYKCCPSCFARMESVKS